MIVSTLCSLTAAQHEAIMLQGKAPQMSLALELRQFTGTENWYQHNLIRKITYTDGVKYLAEKAGAYWLIDKIATLQLEPKIRKQEFQVWKLSVANDKATLKCEDGNDHVVYSEEITFTDFPLDHIDLWFENNVIMLPSER